MLIRIPIRTCHLHSKQPFFFFIRIAFYTAQEIDVFLGIHVQDDATGYRDLNMHTNITENEKLMTIISALPDLVFILTESGRYADIFGGSDSEFYHLRKDLSVKILMLQHDFEKHCLNISTIIKTELDLTPRYEKLLIERKNYQEEVVKKLRDLMPNRNKLIEYMDKLIKESLK